MKKFQKKILIAPNCSKNKIETSRKSLNLNYLELTNKTYLTSKNQFPIYHCNTNIIPNYLALYTQPKTYHKTSTTAVCFYTYDNTFDGIYGLYNAIYHKNKKLLNYYKNRFKNVKIFISPDYSQFGDLNKPENIYRRNKALIVSIWLTIELGAIVIPNITYISEETFPLFFEGLETCSVIAFSTKGHMKHLKERNLLKAAVKYAVDNLPLKTIIVYSVCTKNENIINLFKYAIIKGIKVVVPQNSLKERNQEAKTYE